MSDPRQPMRRSPLSVEPMEAIASTDRRVRLVDPSAPLGQPVHRVIPSPIGPLTLVGVGQVLSHCWFEGPGNSSDPSEGADRDDEAFSLAVDQLSDYFDGNLRAFDLEAAPVGTPFQRKVWAALCEIPHGQTWSYGHLAEHVGSPGGARAVGLANGRNPIAVIVPCHRVIGANGTLTGYAGGLDRKQRLLALESSAPTLW